MMQSTVPTMRRFSRAISATASPLTRSATFVENMRGQERGSRGKLVIDMAAAIRGLGDLKGAEAR